MRNSANSFATGSASKGVKLQKQLEHLSAEAVRLRENFVRSEVDISFTLAEFATATHRPDRALASARQGYHTARKFLALLPPSPVRNHLENDLNALRILLERGASMETRAVPAPGRPQDTVETLTTRELEVLESIAEGNSTKQVAQRLGIAFKTAACHRQHLMAKLGVHDSVSLVRYAIRRGIARV